MRLSLPRMARSVRRRLTPAEHAVILTQRANELEEQARALEALPKHAADAPIVADLPAWLPLAAERLRTGAADLRWAAANLERAGGRSASSTPLVSSAGRERVRPPGGGGGTP